MDIIKGFQARIVNKEVELQDLATTESDCSSAKKGGNYGYAKYRRSWIVFSWANAAFF
jgi:NIMA-interacting peptidyl-prolyl cis-trans isomerase 1